MGKYRKGANAERELIQTLWGLGLAVARVAGSGGCKLPAPDLVALGKGKRLAFECKAWDNNYLNISNEQMGELDEWCGRAEAEYFIAWKVPREGWYFLSKEAFKKTPKGYNINRSTAKKKAINLGIIVGNQSVLGGDKNDGN